MQLLVSMSERTLSVLVSNVKSESGVKETSKDSGYYTDYAKFLALLLVLGCAVLNATLPPAQGKRHQPLRTKGDNKSKSDTIIKYTLAIRR